MYNIVLIKNLKNNYFLFNFKNSKIYIVSEVYPLNIKIKH